MNVLEQALAALEYYRSYVIHDVGMKYTAGDEAIAALKEAIKNQGEPVAFGSLDGHWVRGVDYSVRPDKERFKIAFYTSAPSIQEGWQRVPKEPTKLMLDAFWDNPENIPEIVHEDIKKSYKAMLSAAPEYKGEK